MNIHDQIKNLEEQIALLKEQCNSPLLPTMIQLSDRAYSVGETPVTVAQYEDFCHMTNREMPEQPAPHRPNNPVVNVSFHDAQAYADWLSKETGDAYRLPTEDEFEHFCGDHTEGDADIAVYSQAEIKPVKTKQPNKYGLYDVLGCVWEWQDSFYE